MSSDERFLRRALELARRASGLTFPNPRVGAVLVRGGRVLGAGFHRRAGAAHAEVNAVADAKRMGHRLEGSTLYVTLEPCSTHGRTPPCTGLIIREGIARVVYAATDPNPAHAGAAAKLLRAAGITVTHGVLAAEATALNRDFNWSITRRCPWVTGKMALSLDGRITTPPGDDRWLTSPASRQAAHQLRREADAILIGAETARADNPRLTVRVPGLRGKRQPWRVVLTRSGNLPGHLHLFSDRHRERTLVYRQQPLPEVLADLGRRGVTHVLIEGGGEVLTDALRQNLVNDAAFFVAPAMMGTAPRALHRLAGAGRALRDVSYEWIGRDLLCRGTLRST